MIEKKPVSGTDIISVTFRSPASEDASTIHLLGGFNNWSPERHPFKLRKDGSWSVTVRLPRNERHQFRYLVNGETWVTDEESDGLIENEYGGRNGVVVT